MQHNDPPIDNLLPQFRLINHKIAQISRGNATMGSIDDTIEQACKKLSQIVKLDLGNKDYQDVVRYAKDIYKKVKNEGVVAAYYVNTYTALLMKKNDLRTSIMILRKFTEENTNLNKYEIYSTMEVSLAGCFFMAKNYSACLKVSKNLIKRIERSVLDTLKDNKATSKESMKRLNILLKAYLNLGISSMLITEVPGINKYGSGRKNSDSKGISHGKEFKSVFIKGYNLSKKYFGDCMMTKKFQLYTFEAMKYKQMSHSNDTKNKNSVSKSNRSQDKDRYSRFSQSKRSRKSKFHNNSERNFSTKTPFVSSMRTVKYKRMRSDPHNLEKTGELERVKEDDVSEFGEIDSQSQIQDFTRNSEIRSRRRSGYDYEYEKKSPDWANKLNESKKKQYQSRKGKKLILRNIKSSRNSSVRRSRNKEMIIKNRRGKTKTCRNSPNNDKQFSGLNFKKNSRSKDNSNSKQYKISNTKKDSKGYKPSGFRKRIQPSQLDNERIESNTPETLLNHPGNSTSNIRQSLEYLSKLDEVSPINGKTKKQIKQIVTSTGKAVNKKYQTQGPQVSEKKRKLIKLTPSNQKKGKISSQKKFNSENLDKKNRTKQEFSSMKKQLELEKEQNEELKKKIQQLSLAYHHEIVKNSREQLNQDSNKNIDSTSLVGDLELKLAKETVYKLPVGHQSNPNLAKVNPIVDKFLKDQHLDTNYSSKNSNFNNGMQSIAGLSSIRNSEHDVNTTPKQSNQFKIGSLHDLNDTEYDTSVEKTRQLKKSNFQNPTKFSTEENTPLNKSYSPTYKKPTIRAQNSSPDKRYNSEKNQKGQLTDRNSEIHHETPIKNLEPPKIDQMFNTQDLIRVVNDDHSVIEQNPNDDTQFLGKNNTLNEIFSDNMTTSDPLSNKLNFETGESEKIIRKDGVKKSKFFKNVDYRNRSMTPETCHGISNVLNELGEHNLQYSEKLTPEEQNDKFGSKIIDINNNFISFKGGKNSSQFKSKLVKESLKNIEQGNNRKKIEEEEKYLEDQNKNETNLTNSDMLDRSSKFKPYTDENTRNQSKLAGGFGQGILNNQTSTVGDMNQFMNHSSQNFTPRHFNNLHSNTLNENKKQMNMSEVINLIKDSSVMKITESRFDQIRDSIQLMSLNWQNSQLQNHQMLNEVKNMYNGMMTMHKNDILTQQVLHSHPNQGHNYSPFMNPNHANHFNLSLQQKQRLEQLNNMQQYNHLGTIQDANESPYQSRFERHDSMNNHRGSPMQPQIQRADSNYSRVLSPGNNPNQSYNSYQNSQKYGHNTSKFNVNAPTKSENWTTNISSNQNINYGGDNYKNHNASGSYRNNQNSSQASINQRILNQSSQLMGDSTPPLQMNQLPISRPPPKKQKSDVTHGNNQFQQFSGNQKNYTSQKKMNLTNSMNNSHHFNNETFGLRSRVDSGRLVIGSQQRDKGGATYPRQVMNESLINSSKGNISKEKIKNSKFAQMNSNNNSGGNGNRSGNTNHDDNSQRSIPIQGNILPDNSHLRSQNSIILSQNQHQPNSQNMGQQNLPFQNGGAKGSGKLMQNYFEQAQKQLDQQNMQNNASNPNNGIQEPADNYTFPPAPSPMQEDSVFTTNNGFNDSSGLQRVESPIHQGNYQDQGQDNMGIFQSPMNGIQNQNVLFTMDGDVLDITNIRPLERPKEQGVVNAPEPVPIDLNSIKESILGEKITLIQMFYKRGIHIQVEASLFREERTQSMIMDNMRELNENEAQSKYELKFELVVMLESFSLSHELSSYSLQKLEVSEGEFVQFIASIDPNLLDLFPHEVLSFNHAEYLLKIFVGRFCDVEIDDVDKSVRVGLRNTLRPLAGGQDLLMSPHYVEAVQKNNKIRLARQKEEDIKALDLDKSFTDDPELASEDNDRLRILHKEQTDIANGVLDAKKKQSGGKSMRKDIGISELLEEVDNFSQEENGEAHENTIDMKEELLPDPGLLFEEGFSQTIIDQHFKVMFYHNDQTDFMLTFEGINDGDIHYKCAVTFVEVVFNQYFETVTVPGVEMDQFKRTIIDEMEENDEFKRKLKRELRNLEEQKVAKNVVIVKEDMKLELTALLIQVTQQTIEEVEKIFASGETTEELFWSVRIVDKFESFILFLIKDQPEQEQVDLSIFYKITTKSKMNDFTLIDTSHKKVLEYSFFYDTFGIDFKCIHFLHKKYFLQIITDMFNFLPMESEAHDSDSDSQKEAAKKSEKLGDGENEKPKEKKKSKIVAKFILKQKGFTIGAFKREYTGGHYRWPLTLTVVCLNNIPYGIKMGFFDFARCRENCLFLSLYSSDWINEDGNFNRLYDFLNRVGFTKVLKKLLVDREGNIYIGVGPIYPDRMNHDSLERLIEIGLKKRRRRRPRQPQAMVEQLNSARQPTA